MRIVALCGSLRRASCNMGLLRHCQTVLAAKGVTLDIVSQETMGRLPLLNSDHEGDEAKMVEVKKYWEQLDGADAYLFATCEYNASISAALKNGIDWGTRATQGNLFNEKPGAMIGAGGYAGTTRAQTALRDIFFEVNLKNMNGAFGSGLQARVQIFTPQPGEGAPFDDETGDLVSPFWQAELEKMMAGLVAWAKRIKVE